MYLIINNINYNIHGKIWSIIQLCESLNIYIPRFCYHNKLSIAGNCRMCLVDTELLLPNGYKQKKIMIACGTAIINNLTIFTFNKVVKKIQENILEFLLINHPLDCPICDQGGECDLQDQVIIYGNDRNRFTEKKRTVSDKNFGVFIKSIMTRCIHCTRCIRFYNEIIGFNKLGLLGRGINNEISTYNNTILNSEISGNIIDLCPVGALTSKPFSFTGRSWELLNIESIDILDSVCSSIRIDIKGSIVMRILPVKNNKLNEDWITDKIRFSYDSFLLQRIMMPHIKIKNKFILTSYEKIFIYLKKNINLIVFNKLYDSCIFVVGDLINILSQILFKYFSRFLGFFNLNIFLSKNIDQKQYYLMNDSLNNIEIYNIFLLCNVNTKIESSILNIKLKKIKNNNNSIKIFYIGTNIMLNYDLIHLGFTCELFLNIYFGQHYICKNIWKLKKICCIGNNSFFTNDNIFNLMFITLLKKLNLFFSYNYISLFSSELNTYDLGLQSSLKIQINNNWFRYSTPKIIYLLGVDYINQLNFKKNKSLIIYQGHHADSGLFLSDIILPSSTFIETEGHYINCEGLLKYAPKILDTYTKTKILPDSLIIFSLLNYISNFKTKSFHTFIQYINKIYPYRLNKQYIFFNIFDKLFKYEYIYFHDAYYINKIKSYYTLDVFNRNSNNIVKHLILSFKKKNNFF